MAQKARYDLQQVFQLAADGKYWFPAKTRSSYAVMKIYNLSSEEAETFILKAIRELTEAHFCERVIQWGDSKCIADVYGLIYDGRPWYVKLRIEDDFLEEISFHPPEKEMKTVGGMVIPKGVEEK